MSEENISKKSIPLVSTFAAFQSSIVASMYVVGGKLFNPTEEYTVVPQTFSDLMMLFKNSEAAKKADALDQKASLWLDKMKIYMPNIAFWSTYTFAGIVASMNVAYNGNWVGGVSAAMLLAASWWAGNHTESSVNNAITNQYLNKRTSLDKIDLQSTYMKDNTMNFIKWSALLAGSSLALVNAPVLIAFIPILYFATASRNNHYLGPRKFIDIATLCGFPEGTHNGPYKELPPATSSQAPAPTVPDNGGVK